MSKSIERKAHWEQVYAGKSPRQVSWFQQQPQMSLRLIRNTGIDLTDPIIDVGGGASVLVDYLIRADFENLSVLDIAASSLAHARQRLGDEAANIEWIEADITGFKAPHAYRLWHDRAVFHFLTDADDRRSYVEALKQAVPPGGHVVLAAFSIGGPLKCSGLNIVQYNADKLLGELGSGFSLIEQVSELHQTPSGGNQQFSYFRLIRQ